MMTYVTMILCGEKSWWSKIQPGEVH